MVKHKLSKLDLLEYALDGAYERQGTLHKAERDLVDKDIAEIERRIKLVKVAQQRAERNTQ